MRQYPSQQASSCLLQQHFSWGQRKRFQAPDTQTLSAYNWPGCPTGRHDRLIPRAKDWRN